MEKVTAGIQSHKVKDNKNSKTITCVDSLVDIERWLLRETFIAQYASDWNKKLFNIQNSSDRSSHSYRVFHQYGFCCECRDMACDKMQLGILCTEKVVLGLEKEIKRDTIKV